MGCASGFTGGQANNPPNDPQQSTNRLVTCPFAAPQRMPAVVGPAKEPLAFRVLSRFAHPDTTDDIFYQVHPYRQACMLTERQIGVF